VKTRPPRPIIFQGIQNPGVSVISLKVTREESSEMFDLGRKSGIMGRDMRVIVGVSQRMDPECQAASGLFFV